MRTDTTICSSLPELGLSAILCALKMMIRILKGRRVIINVTTNSHFCCQLEMFLYSKRASRTASHVLGLFQLGRVCAPMLHLANGRPLRWKKTLSSE